MGLRLAGLGGGAVDSARLERIKAEAKRGGRGGGAADLLRGGHARAGAPGAERRHRPREAPGARRSCQEPMRWIWRGFCAGLPAEGAHGRRGGRARAATWRFAGRSARRTTIDEVLPAGGPRAERAGARGGAGVRAAAARARPAAGAARAAGQPPELLGPRGLPALRLPLLPRAGARARAAWTPPLRSRRAGRRPRGSSALLRGTVVHGLLERLDFAQPGSCRATRTWPPPSSCTAGGAARRRRGRPRHGRAASPARRCASASRPRGACAPSCRSPSRSTPPAGGRSLLDQRRGGRARRRGRADAGRRLQERRRSASATRRSSSPRESYSTQRLVYALAALRPGAERVEVVHCFLERPDEPAVGAVRGGRRGARSSASCSSWRRASSRAASSPPPSRISRYVRTAPAGRRCAVAIAPRSRRLQAHRRLSVGTPS